jgi:release factor glutamine methyltransferase
MTDKWTVLRLIQWCRDYFTEKGIESARLDGEVLLAHVLGVDRVGLYLRYDQPLSPEELAAFHELVRRRGKREPVSHLVGAKEFRSLRFAIDGRALTPRPETELLVDVLLDGLPAEAPARVCEVGVGSGCVAVSAAVARPAWRIEATDISAGALALAAANVAQHQVGERVALSAGDLFGELTGPYDAVVSNPPYVTTNELRAAMPEVARYEPAVALDGGPDGLAVIRRLADEAPTRLRAGGLLALECGAGQAPRVIELLAGRGAYEQMAAHRDLAGVERVVSARRKEE